MFLLLTIMVQVGIYNWVIKKWVLLDLENNLEEIDIYDLPRNLSIASEGISKDIMTLT